ncbi:hypothetical protein EJB05_27933, partial [Eragrostis curvula]
MAKAKARTNISDTQRAEAEAESERLAKEAELRTAREQEERDKAARAEEIARAEEAARKEEALKAMQLNNAETSQAASFQQEDDETRNITERLRIIEQERVEREKKLAIIEKTAKLKKDMLEKIVQAQQEINEMDSKLNKYNEEMENLRKQEQDAHHKPRKQTEHKMVAVKLPDGFGKLDSLQVLSFVGVSISPNFAKELGHLTELRALQMFLSGDTSDKSYEKPLVNSLCNLRKVCELDIDVNGVLSTEFMADIGWVPQHLCRFTGVTLSRLPRWISSSLLCLTYVYIKNVNRLGHEDVQNLGAMPFLHYLYLSVVQVITAEERLCIRVIDHAKFQNLCEFRFHNYALGLIFAQGAMPRLETIEVIFRASEAKNTYGDFDLGLQNLSSLKYVTVRIDCSSSSISDIAAADAAMWKAIAMNPNCPKLDVIKYFEDETIEENGDFQLHYETTKEEEQQQETMPDKVGPWGGDGGRVRDVKVAPHRLRSLKICCGDIIDAFAFSYEDRQGKQHKTPLWGGVGGRVQTIHLGPSEILIEVSGTTGPYDSANGTISEVVTSLRLITNVRTYGPYGVPRWNHFRTPSQRNSSIVGFHTRSGQYVDAIGVYFSPMISGS